VEVSVDDWIELCTACRLCDTVCPAGVPISELNLMAKAKYLDERGRTFRDWLLVRSDLFGELASRFFQDRQPPDEEPRHPVFPR
jgi:glycerol-3-phosphate dehydrogenase subunit C